MLTASAARGGDFATSRKGGIADDYDFIMQKAMAGVPASAIARMIARPVADVRQVIGLRVQAQEPAPPVIVPRVAQKKWAPWKPKSRVRSKFSLPPRARAIVQAVADRHGYSLEDVLGRGATGNLPNVRMEAYHALYSAKRGYSLPMIGSWFDGRDHTTVYSGVRRHAQRLADDADLQAWTRLGCAA